MEFRGLTLDRFQVEAIGHLDKGASVVVSAATGTGKTVIADYVIDKSFKEGRKVFYTAPIKALSNQKFSQFKAIYGDENVGILTGDVSHNPGAPLVIMTTEIYRNMLLAKDPIVNDLAAVVFDEIHYLGDVERGTVWEECIIFSPEHVRFVCLSATIPNARQFANWISAIKHHTIEVVTERKRAVPLEHLFFDTWFGESNIEEIRHRKNERAYPKYEEAFGGGRGGGRNRRGGFHRNQRAQQRMAHANPHAAQRAKRVRLTHLDLIARLRQTNRLSCIYFCFSRANTEKKAVELSRRTTFLSREQERAVRDLCETKLASTDAAVARLGTTRDLLSCLEHGIAFHHAGLLPVLKEMVEQVFEHGLLSVLYATETFAVGINLPARTVCFDSLEKYDGQVFRHLTTTEYFQLAGRAGRRGMDKLGYVFSMVDPEFADLERVARIVTGETEPLESQYQLSYNTILNMITHHDRAQRETILRSSFYTYQRAGDHKERILQVYEKKVKRLRELGYLVDDETLSARGEFARHIYSNELVVTELFTSSLAHSFSDLHIILLCAALEYEDRRLVSFARAPSPATHELLDLCKPYREIHRWLRESGAAKLEPLLAAWVGGGSFEGLTRLTTMPEGDIVRFFRRIIDVLQQVLHAVILTVPDEHELRDRVVACIAAVDRGIVQARL
jgi:superfamily II RNA helicase